MASEIVSDHATDEISSVEVSDSSDFVRGIVEDEKGFLTSLNLIGVLTMKTAPPTELPQPSRR